MDTQTIYELIGYLASGLILVSLLMQSLLRLRLINLVGAIVFTVYGLLIDAPPVWLVNGAIAVIDVYYLRKMLTARQETYELLEVQASSRYLQRFLDEHGDDIARYQPEFDGVTDEQRTYLILRDVMPVGVISARVTDPATAWIDLDYVVQGHRDLKPGRFVFEGSGLADRLNVRRATTDPGTEAHQRYLRRVGFEPAGDHWVREVHA